MNPNAVENFLDRLLSRETVAECGKSNAKLEVCPVCKCSEKECKCEKDGRKAAGETE